MKFFLRAWRLAALAYVVASCGVDVVGEAPLPPPGPPACVFDNPSAHFDGCAIGQ